MLNLKSVSTDVNEVRSTVIHIFIIQSNQNYQAEHQENHWRPDISWFLRIWNTFPLLVTHIPKCHSYKLIPALPNKPILIWSHLQLQHIAPQTSTLFSFSQGNISKITENNQATDQKISHEYHHRRQSQWFKIIKVSEQHRKFYPKDFFPLSLYRILLQFSIVDTLKEPMWRWLNSKNFDFNHLGPIVFPLILVDTFKEPMSVSFRSHIFVCDLILVCVFVVGVSQCCLNCCDRLMINWRCGFLC